MFPQATDYQPNSLLLAATRISSIWAPLGRRLRVFAVLLCLPYSLASQQQVVASFEHGTVTSLDLDQFVGDQLIRQNTEIFLKRQNLLSEYVDQLLLSQEAASRGVTERDLIASEITNKVDHPLTVLIHDTSLNPTQSREREYILELRQKYKAHLDLQPPRLQNIYGSGAPVKGSPNAPIEIMEFSDFQCPYCKNMNITLEKLMEAFPGQLKIKFIHFPLNNHTMAPKAATFAVCAGRQNRFWEAHDYLFSHSDILYESALSEYGQQLGLNPDSLKNCMTSEQAKLDWVHDRALGIRLGVLGTPTLIINGRLVLGANSFSGLAAVIEDEIARKTQASHLEKSSLKKEIQ